MKNEKELDNIIGKLKVISHYLNEGDERFDASSVLKQALNLEKWKEEEKKT
jgi:hypothetical protein